MNGAVAHEFGHALGLKHTFTEESKVTKIKEETVVKEDGFYSTINKRLILIKDFFTLNYEADKYWAKYEGQKTVVTIMDYGFHDIIALCTKEKEHIVNNSIADNLVANNPVVNSTSDSSGLEKKQTKENFMNRRSAELII